MEKTPKEVLNKALSVIEREVNNIFNKSATKLDSGLARDLAVYIKILCDVQDRADVEANTARSMSEEQLKKIAAGENG